MARSKYIFLLAAVILLAACRSDAEKAYNEAYKMRVKDNIVDLEKAVDKFDDSFKFAIASLDGKSSTLKALGIKMTQAEMYLEAAKVFEQAKQITPTDETLYYYLGLSYANYAEIQEDKKLRNEYINKAENEYKSGIELATNSMALCYAYGVLAGFLKNETQEGIELLEEAKKLDSNDLAIYFALANLYYKYGNNEEAIRHYREIMSRVPEGSDKWNKAEKNLRLIKGSF